MSTACKSVNGNGDQELKNICLHILKNLSPRGLEFFEDVPIDGTRIMFILATDECGFLINQAKNSLIRECHKMVRALSDLRQREPLARCFGILTFNGGFLPQQNLVDFCRKLGIFFMTYDDIADFINARLKK